MASKHLDERPGRAANGGARPKNGEDEDSVVVRVVEEFLVAQSHCSRANVEATLGTFLPVSPRKSAARGLGGLAAKRVVLLTLIGLLGSEDPKIFDYAVELVEEYHAALVAVWPEDRVPSQSLQAGWLETSLDPLPHLVSKTGA
ncbi:MAG: hypothetical protein J0H99_23465 [Rhodospirillales bacterium]|nr:hypothetical protein [Rhodospirillales bacterium]